jgi:hypothetical protein
MCQISFWREEKNEQRDEILYLECHYVDFDDKAFEKILIKFAILKFCETKKIDSLDAFSLEYHSNKI